MLNETARGEVGKPMLDEAACSEVGKVVLGEATHGEVGEDALDEVACDKVSEAILGEATHDKVGEATPIKIRARMGTWWRRASMAFQEVASSGMVVDLKNCYGGLTL